MLFCSWEDYLVSCFCADLVKNGFVSVKIDLCGLSCAETHAYSTGCREQSWLDPSCRALLPQGINDIQGVGWITSFIFQFECNNCMNIGMEISVLLENRLQNRERRGEIELCHLSLINHSYQNKFLAIHYEMGNNSFYYLHVQQLLRRLNCTLL